MPVDVYFCCFAGLPHFARNDRVRVIPSGGVAVVERISKNSTKFFRYSIYKTHFVCYNINVYAILAHIFAILT